MTYRRCLQSIFFYDMLLLLQRRNRETSADASVRSAAHSRARKYWFAPFGAARSPKRIVVGQRPTYRIVAAMMIVVVVVVVVEGIVNIGTSNVAVVGCR